MRSRVLSALPYPIQIVVGLLAYRNQSQTLYGQGTGRLSVDEIDSFRLQIWENVNALLTASKEKIAKRGVRGEMFWVLGNSGPSEADMVLFGFIASALVCAAYVPLAVAANQACTDPIFHQGAQNPGAGKELPRRGRLRPKDS